MDYPQLIDAAKCGRSLQVGLLLEQGDDPNMVYRSDTPLIYASRRDDNIDVVMALLADPRTDLNKRSGDTGLTPLMISLLHCSHNVMRTLLDHGADLDHLSYDGYTVLMIAVSNNMYKDVKTLLSYNPNIGIRNNDRMTMYTLAKNEKMRSIIRPYLILYKRMPESYNDVDICTLRY